VGFQLSLFSSGFLTKILYVFLISPVFATYPAHLILIYQPNNIWGKGTAATYLQNDQYLLILDEMLIFLPDSSQ
jgi:hypothetical protein